jgi:kinesin family member 11
MSTQMAAWDEFVTRARSQNDTSHEEHKAGLLQLQLQVVQNQTDLTSALSERQTAIKTFHEDETHHAAEYSEQLGDFDRHIRSGLDALAEDVNEAMPQDYVPTGETPQKRTWTYPSELPATAAHESIIARRRGLPDPTIESTARTPGRSPKKGSPRKSPNKSSPIKTKVYADKTEKIQIKDLNLTEPLNMKSLKEVDINVAGNVGKALEREAHTISFSKSIGTGQPPLKRHATAGDARVRGLRSKAAPVTPGVENLSQSVGPGVGRRLRSSPPE